MSSLKALSQRTYMHMGIAHGLRQQCGECYAGGGEKGEMDVICNSVNNRNNNNKK